MAINKSDWFQGDIPNNITNLYFLATGGTKEFSVSLVNCINPSANISFTSNRNWCTVSWNSNTGIVTIIVDTNTTTSTRDATITKNVNGNPCYLTIHQDKMEECSCKNGDYANNITWFNGNKIPASGLSANQIIGHFNGGCIHAQPTAQLLADIFYYDESGIRQTIPTTIQNWSGQECDIVLSESIPPNTSLYNERTLSANTYSGQTGNNYRCGTTPILQETSDICDSCADAAKYFIKDFKTRWTLSGSDGHLVYIGSGDTSGCGSLSATTTSSIIKSLTTTTDATNSAYTFSCIIEGNGPTTGDSGDINIYYIKDGETTSKCWAGITVTRRNVACVDCNCRSATIDTFNTEKDIHLSSLEQGQTRPIISGVNGTYSAECYSDSCDIKPYNNHSPYSDNAFIYIPTHVNCDWMEISCAGGASTCSDPYVHINANTSNLPRIGEITYTLFIDIDVPGLTRTCEISSDHKSAEVTFNGGGYRCSTVTLIIKQLEVGHCKCRFMSNESSDVGNSLDNGPVLFGGITDFNSRCNDDIIYVSASNYWVSNGSASNAYTASTTIHGNPNSCGTIEIIGDGSTWYTINSDRDAITFEKNTYHYSRSATTTVKLNSSDGNCLTTTKTIVQLPLVQSGAYSNPSWANYIHTILMAQRLYSRSSSTCYSPTYQTSGNFAYYTFTIDCTSNSIELPSQIQGANAEYLFSAYTSDQYGGKSDSSWIRIESGDSQTSHTFKTLAIRVYQNNFDTPRTGFVTITRSSYLPIVILAIIQNNGNCGSVTPTCSCNNFDNFITAATSFVSSDSLQKLGTVSISDSDCVRFTVGTTVDEVKDITIKNDIEVWAKLKLKSGATIAQASISVAFINRETDSNCKTISVSFEIHT